MTKEKLNLKNPTVVALEISALAFLAWKLKENYDRRHDKPDAKEPQPYPMNVLVDETQVYLYPGYEDGLFIAGAVDPAEGLIEVQGKRVTDPTGTDKITIDESYSEKDLNRLEILREKFARLSSEWSERKKS